MTTTRTRQNLLIDADDTLWANNVFFERAIANFISFLNHQEYTPTEVREVLNEVERECIVKRGYGMHSFAHALVYTFERLSVEPLTPAIRDMIRGFAHEAASHPIEIFDGVADTLEYLAGRHRLIMVTKGNVVEQSGKVERSGLRDWFRAIEIVGEKDSPAYRMLTDKYALAKDQTWMIGNSPFSDINPALQAGLNAVFIPNEMTWVLENCEVDKDGAPGELLVIEKFAELQRHF